MLSIVGFLLCLSGIYQLIDIAQKSYIGLLKGLSYYAIVQKHSELFCFFKFLMIYPARAHTFLLKIAHDLTINSVYA
jgi:hypothetical protein